MQKRNLSPPHNHLPRRERVSCGGAELLPSNQIKPQKHRVKKRVHSGVTPTKRPVVKVEWTGFLFQTQKVIISCDDSTHTLTSSLLFLQQKRLESCLNKMIISGKGIFYTIFFHHYKGDTIYKPPLFILSFIK